ncbi:hypothetical protein CVS40_12913 [Lucilia cuprina]|nr:hypothetical protein CVS40_12913 [Lucilia cuprina]
MCTNTPYYDTTIKNNQDKSNILHKPFHVRFKNNLANLNSKLCKKFVKCRVVKRVGKSLYELENLAGRKVGVYHAKDLQHISPRSIIKHSVAFPALVDAANHLWMLLATVEAPDNLLVPTAQRQPLVSWQD